MWSLYPKWDFDPFFAQVPSRLRRVSACSPGGMSRTGGDERGVLHDAAPDGEPLYFELPLELLPDHSIFPGFGQAFPEQPDRRPIRNGLWIPEEVAERIRSVA